MKLFTEGKANAKLAKSVESDYLTIGLFLAPHKENGLGVNLCPFASEECVTACLDDEGRARLFPMIHEARKRKAQYFIQDRAGFLSQVKREIGNAEKRAERDGKKLVVRLNGTSDIDYPADVFNSFPNVVFYDYTKSPIRLAKYIAGSLPKNYHLTFSFSGDNLDNAIFALRKGVNVSVVFADSLPETWQGFPVVNGDLTDLRFLDPSGVVVGLKAKGQSKRKVTLGGFIQIAKAKPAKWESVEACQFHKVPLTNGAECAVCKHSI